MSQAMAGSPLILIIDDVRASRETLVRVVASLGYRTAQAASGIEGVSMTKRLRPSLVLLDVVMPMMDGFKVTAAIKSLPSFVPVILLTALDDLDSKRRGQVAGADDYLAKPVSRLELQIRIAAMLRIKSLTDALEEARAQLAALADTDALTGIANRRGFERALQAECERGRRYGHPISVLMLDIDHFKRVNDTYGHATGDAVIRAVAQAAEEEARTTDTVGRVGGEEFAILLPETDGSGAAVVAERLRTRARAVPIRIGDRLLHVTVSLGIATWACSGTFTAHDLMLLADDALYHSKRAGRNRVTAHTLAERALAI